MQWIGLFHPFTSDSMESVRIPRELGTRIAAFLQELTEPRAAEVLLNYITCIEQPHLVVRPLSESGPLQRAIDEFIATHAPVPLRPFSRGVPMGW